MTDFGSRHWKVVRGEAGELRVEPYGYAAAGWFCVFCVSAVILTLCLWPGVDLAIRVIVVFVGGAAGVTMSSLFFWIHSHEGNLGPFLIITPDAIKLRYGRSIPRREFASFEVRRKLERSAGVAHHISRLNVCCTSGEEIWFLASTYSRALVKLKQTLDEFVGQASA